MTKLVWLERVLLILVRSMPVRIWHSLMVRREREKLISSTRKVVNWPTLYSSRFMEYELKKTKDNSNRSYTTPLSNVAIHMSSAVWVCVGIQKK